MLGKSLHVLSWAVQRTIPWSIEDENKADLLQADIQPTGFHLQHHHHVPARMAIVQKCRQLFWSRRTSSEDEDYWRTWRTGEDNTASLRPFRLDFYAWMIIWQSLNFRLHAAMKKAKDRRVWHHINWHGHAQPSPTPEEDLVTLQWITLLPCFLQWL